MPTQLCPSPQRRQPRRPANPPAERRSRGQVLVIFAVSLLALLFFVGLAIDAGIAYVSYGQLKRAVDSAAVAAANNFKRGASYDQMVSAVLESLKVQNVNVDPAALQLNVQVCDKDKDGVRDDARLAVEAPELLPMCPETDPGDETAPPARKLVYVEARQLTPFYFLSILGFNGISLRTWSTAEAAAIDLVLVIDTSESMAAECKDPPGANAGSCIEFKTLGYSRTTMADYNAALCNSRLVSGVIEKSRCYPLRDAIDAAKELVNTLYEGYDQIGIVTYNTKATVIRDLAPLEVGNKQIVLDQIDLIQLHDDAPVNKLWVNWLDNPDQVNPANPEDRDGDGRDADPGKPCTLDEDRWDQVRNVPCDDDTLVDAFDWDQDGVYTPADTDLAVQWMTDTHNDNMALVSTCTGCGMRAASNQLRASGRPGSVWVIIFLSDGAVNMSDTADAVNDDSVIPTAFKNGFCTQRFWGDFCMDMNPSPRYCIDEDSSTCPPHTVYNPQAPSVSTYSSLDYAKDMTDAAALRVVNAVGNPDYNPNEPIGNDVAIYSIGLGPAISTGESLLRYMAAVGDDGDRVTDPCKSKPAKTDCGQYYFSSTGGGLAEIFDKIASRIYTKIAH